MMGTIATSGVGAEFFAASTARLIKEPHAMGLIARTWEAPASANVFMSSTNGTRSRRAVGASTFTLTVMGCGAGATRGSAGCARTAPAAAPSTRTAVRLRRRI